MRRAVAARVSVFERREATGGRRKFVADARTYRSEVAPPTSHFTPPGAFHMSSVLEQLVNKPYEHGFRTDIEAETAPKGLNEDTIRLISSKKNEPEWLLEFRLKAYRHWLTMQ